MLCPVASCWMGPTATRSERWLPLLQPECVEHHSDVRGRGLVQDRSNAKKDGVNTIHGCILTLDAQMASNFKSNPLAVSNRNDSNRCDRSCDFYPRSFPRI